MGLFDFWKKKAIPKNGLEQFIEHNEYQILKEARTPVYDAAAATSYGTEVIEPPFDQHYVEYLADQYSHLRTVIQTITTQTVAKGFEVTQVNDNASEDQKHGLEKLLKDPSNGDADITGTELVKAIVRQLEIFDDAYISVVYDYVRNESGEVLGKKPRQLWLEDAKRLRFNTDRFGRFQTEDKFCPICRKEGGGTHCANEDCGDVKLRYIAFTFTDEEENIYFARDEIIHLNKYSASARLYGHPPIMGLAKKIETALAVESYQSKLYKLERPPKGFLDIPGHNEDALSRLGEYIAQETARNPNFIPIISSGEGKSGASFLSVMPDSTELGMLPYIEKINGDINSTYGVMPLAVGDTSGIGGLNSEGEQITMMDKTIIETQQVIKHGFFDALCKLMNITDWEITFNPVDERNEQQYLQNLTQKLEIIRGFQELGIVIDMDDEGELILPEDGIKEELSESQQSQEVAEQSEPHSMFNP